MKKSKKCRKRIKGFTLIELVITITIVVILSMISVPLYKDYMYDSKRSEGYVLLSTIRDAQLQYFAEYENFLCYDHASGGTSYTCFDEVLGVNARLNKYFTYMSVGPWKNDGRHTTAFIARVSSKDYGSITLNYDLKQGATTI